MRVDGPAATYVFRDERAARRLVAGLGLLAVVPWALAASGTVPVAFPVVVTVAVAALAVQAWRDRPVIRIAEDELAFGREGGTITDRFATARISSVVVRVNLSTQVSVLDTAGSVADNRWLRFVTGRALSDALARADVRVERTGATSPEASRAVTVVDLPAARPGALVQGLAATGAALVLAAVAFPIGAEVSEAAAAVLLALALVVVVAGWVRAGRRPTPLQVTVSGLRVHLPDGDLEIAAADAPDRVRRRRGGVVLLGPDGAARLRGIGWRELRRASHLWATPLPAAADGR